MTENLIAFLWGLAEATLFFIIPDVWISIVALKDYHAGLQASVYALAGALLGGTIMYYRGRADLQSMIQIFYKLPAIRPVDVEKVRSALMKSGVIAIVLGPTLGIPYKIYAVHAHWITSIIGFLLISIPARMIRFVLAAVATPYLMDKIAPQASAEVRFGILLTIWAIMYTAYFWVKSRR